MTTMPSPCFGMAIERVRGQEAKPGGVADFMKGAAPGQRMPPRLHPCRMESTGLPAMAHRRRDGAACRAAGMIRAHLAFAAQLPHDASEPSRGVVRDHGIRSMSEHSQLWRAPLQGGGRWQYEGKVRIDHGAWVGKRPDGGRRSGLTVSGAIASGRGNSKVVVQIVPEDFLPVMRAMCRENREAAILAFSQAIREFVDPEDSPSGSETLAAR